MKKILSTLFIYLTFIGPGYCYDREEITNINVYEKINPAMIWIIEITIAITIGIIPNLLL